MYCKNSAAGWVTVVWWGAAGPKTPLTGSQRKKLGFVGIQYIPMSLPSGDDLLLLSIFLSVGPQSRLLLLRTHWRLRILRNQPPRPPDGQIETQLTSFNAPAGEGT